MTVRARISRHWFTAVLGFVVLDCVSAAFAAERPDYPGPAACARVDADGPIQFEGRNLVETPDITEPELRRANALLTAGCLDEAMRTWQDFGRRNPDNYHILYVRARWKGLLGGAAQIMADMALRDHPDFASAKVLLASLDLDNKNYSAAAKLLDDVERSQPDDLWAYIDRLRLEAALAPKPSTEDTLSAIMRDSQFPPSVRAQVLRTVQFELARIIQPRPDPMLSSVVEDGSPMAECALYLKAEILIEVRDDPRSGAELIERYLDNNRPCEDDLSAQIRMLLAEAYLLQASEVAPEPGPANAALVGKAKEALRGNLTPVAVNIASIRKFERLIPFLRGFVDPNALDDYGKTMLCNAVRAYNSPMVAEALREHADPNSHCFRGSTDTVLRTFLLTVTPPGEHVTERQEIVRELLSRGASVEGMANSCTPAEGDCATVLLPILKEYEARRAASRTSL